MSKNCWLNGNSADPDQTLQNASGSDQGLQCLLGLCVQIQGSYLSIIYFFVF